MKETSKNSLVNYIRKEIEQKKKATKSRLLKKTLKL